MYELWIEAESFAEKGGWVVDQQSMETIHSSYLMAHGMGIPVADAVTDITVDSDGMYSVWVLTRDWTAVWNVSVPAGQFELSIDEKPLKYTLGTNGAKWSWQLAGKTALSKGNHKLCLHDKTGFNGRCDAIYITDSDDIPSDDISEIDKMRKRLNWKEIKNSGTAYDLIVAGGGIAGICSAISAMRGGLNVLLINDRGVLGGCNSSEIRICMGGCINLPPYENLGNIVKEIAPVMSNPSIYEGEYFEDNRKLFAFEPRHYDQYGNFKIALNESVTGVEMCGCKITAVICTNTLTGMKTRFTASLFSDCSGDAVLARLAGAEVMYGSESRSVYNESLASEENCGSVMGHSIRWHSCKTDSAVSFPDIDWGLKIDNTTCLNTYCGNWEQETGFWHNMITEIEYIRDFGLRAIYSNWSYQKNHYNGKKRFENYSLKWVSAIGGKRESYRVKGDYILTQNDIEDRIFHEDGTSCMSWSIDLHFPEPDNIRNFGEPFRSFAYHRGIVQPYQVPYRCLYSKDIENLFLGGRIVSMSHVAFSSARVMRTLGQLGEVVGIAACICKKHGCNPRDIYKTYLDELKSGMKKGCHVPTAFECPTSDEEGYHIADAGFLWFKPYSCDDENAREKFRNAIKSLGLQHKYEDPEWLK